MSPTTVIAWIRLLVAAALSIYLLIKLFAFGGEENGASIQAAMAVHGLVATAAWLAIDKILGLVESTKTADDKDVEKLKHKVGE